VVLLLQLLPSLQCVSLLLWVLLLLPARAAQLQLPLGLCGTAKGRFEPSLLLHSNTLQQQRSPKSLKLLQQGLYGVQDAALGGGCAKVTCCW
jgi:hypothetical protein